eukprot:674839-Pleurochrysis_carterae.AAC.7
MASLSLRRKDGPLCMSATGNAAAESQTCRAADRCRFRWQAWPASRCWERSRATSLKAARAPSSPSRCSCLRKSRAEAARALRVSRETARGRRPTRTAGAGGSSLAGGRADARREAKGRARGTRAPARKRSESSPPRSAQGSP